MLVAGLLLLAVPAGADAACKVSLGDSTVDFFISQPLYTLRRFPNGGKDLAFAVRNYASFNRASLLAVKSLIAEGNDLQKEAIGQGLAMAAVACLSRDAETARQIADFVRQRNSRQVMKGFLAYIGDNEDDTPARPAPATADTGGSSNSLAPDLSLTNPREPLRGSTAIPAP